MMFTLITLTCYISNFGGNIYKMYCDNCSGAAILVYERDYMVLRHNKINCLRSVSTNVAFNISDIEDGNVYIDNKHIKVVLK